MPETSSLVQTFLGLSVVEGATEPESAVGVGAVEEAPGEVADGATALDDAPVFVEFCVAGAGTGACAALAADVQMMQQHAPSAS